MGEGGSVLLSVHLSVIVVHACAYNFRFLGHFFSEFGCNVPSYFTLLVLELLHMLHQNPITTSK